MNDANSLSGLTVALAESRELDLLARMVEERGGRRSEERRVGKEC